MIRTLELVQSDIEGLTRLMNQWDDLPNEITYEEIFGKVNTIKNSGSKSEIIVAEEDAIIIAYAYLTEVTFLGLDSFIEIQSILVDESVRGNGIGKQLMKQAEEWAKQNGYNKVMLSSRIQLENAHKFYKSIGYKIAKQSYFFSKELK